MKRILTCLLTLTLLITPALAEDSESITSSPLTLTAPSAILMDKSTGEILLEQDAHTQREPASVTKIMTLLLLMEAIDSGTLSKDEIVTVSANAAGQGGSQVYLKEGEQFTVWELMKCVTVVSGNDASVALAEHLCGSVEAFVTQMNDRAAQLGMENTNFVNCTGLTAEGHVTTAYDIALMSRELILNHPDLRELTTIWMDSIRDGSFGLSNTNRLIRYYEGATGLKTGHTDTALYCMSATAEKNGMELIAVVMGCPSSTDRFNDVTAMLDYGFANYTLQEIYPSTPISPIPVLLGTSDYVQPQLSYTPIFLLSAAQQNSVTTEIILAPDLMAPVEQGQKIGVMNVYVDGIIMEEVPLIATQEIPRLTTLDIFSQMLSRLLMAG